MEDEELLRRASFGLRSDEKQVAKVAFMFLTKGDLPLGPLWETFFKGHETHYSIYVHPSPDYNHSLPLNSVFHGRRVPSQVSYHSHSHLQPHHACK